MNAINVTKKNLTS